MLVYKALMATAILLFAASGSPLRADAAAGQFVQPAIQSLEHLTFVGSTNLRAAALRRSSQQVSPDGREVRRVNRGYRAIDVHPATADAFGVATAATIAVPAVAGRAVVAPDEAFFGFPGITHADQRLAGTGIYAATQFSLEPPDQGLCAGDGYVLDVVNNGLTAYTQSGIALIAPLPTSELFGLAPEIIRNANPLLDVFGPSLSDPRCYYDRDTRRWFVTEFEQDINPVTGAGEPRTALFIAISQTSDPTGAYNVLTLDTTDSNHVGCPCLPDQPLLGVDANGIYLTTNEFSLAGPQFNGTQLYAVSKIALALNFLPTVVHLDVGRLPTPDIGSGPWYSVQPAESPDLQSTKAQNGTEYFLSALDFFNKNDNRIAVWSMTNTASLTNPVPAVRLQHVIVRTQSYGIPPPATQKAGYKPLADAQSPKSPLALLDSGDDRMMQVVFAGGRLWAALNTAVVVGGKTQAGIAFFVVTPATGGNLSARLYADGYVAVAGANAIYPSVGVNAAGKAIMTFTLSGPGYYPSAAYVPLNRAGAAVRLAASGRGPDDGFTAYAAYSGTGVGRWGDYSAAVADEFGNIWFAAEYIPNAPRTLLANWGTFVGEIPNH